MKVSVLAGHWLPPSRRVNRPKTDVHRRACLQGWAGGLHENLDCRVPTIPWLEWRSGPKLCTNNTAYAAYLLSSCKSGISVMLGRRCLCDQPAIKVLDIESLTRFSDRQHFTCFELRCPMWLRWERTLGSLRLVSSELWPKHLFPLFTLLYILPP